MGHWTFLRTSTGALRTSKQVDAASALLQGKDYMPVLLPALFAPEELAASPHRRWFHTDRLEAVERLRRLSTQAAIDQRFAVLWEACGPVAEWLAGLDGSGQLVLDVRELAGMWDSPAQVGPALAEAAAVFASLATTWSPDAAQSLLPQHLRRGDRASDEEAICRWANETSPRRARFRLAFGWPCQDRDVSEWRAWFDTGESTVAMPSTDELADRLRSLLTARGWVVFSSEQSQQTWISRFLSVAVREPTRENLQAVLQVMLARGSVHAVHASSSDLEEALRAFRSP